ncbi:BnaC09g13710D [Brassica napus]|uniref:BnaC09g13710D protein n=1 Tax=Brassica napus TaxID=3708 RepID=A0A078G3I0_BRANA|nr:BnaC09g13710D [Brassica napus]
MLCLMHHWLYRMNILSPRRWC